MQLSVRVSHVSGFSGEGAGGGIVDDGRVLSEELEVFKASANRMRWFISTTTLISVLILLHMYLEQFSFQSAQLEGIKGNRIIENVYERQKCMRALITLRKTKRDVNSVEIDQVPECLAPMLPEGVSYAVKALPYEQLVREYSARAYDIKLTNNTLDDVKMPARQIPLLGMQIPANDFVVVMAMMSMVFIVGVWLNLRGVHASLLSLSKHEDRDVMRIARLNTVFLTSLEYGRSRDEGNSFALKVRACSLWLPFFSIVAATLIGYYPAIEDLASGDDGYSGSLVGILVFLFVSIAISIMHFLFAWKCGGVMRDIDEAFKEDDSVSGP